MKCLIRSKISLQLDAYILETKCNISLHLDAYIQERLYMYDAHEGTQILSLKSTTMEQGNVLTSEDVPQVPDTKR